ncbi:MAG: hypothetical protein R3E95_10315 [Thiolinea sp.]
MAREINWESLSIDKWTWDTGTINLQRGYNKIIVNAKDYYGNIDKNEFAIPFGEKRLSVTPDTTKKKKKIPPKIIRFQTTDNEKKLKINVITK